MLAAVSRVRHPALTIQTRRHGLNESYALRLLGDSAAGIAYLLKQRVMEPVSFVDAVRQVAGGGSALDPEVVAPMLERHAPGGPVDRLTQMERAALAGMAERRSNPAIARDLDGSEAALQRRLTKIFGKLNLHQDAEAHRRVLAVLTYLRAQDS